MIYRVLSSESTLKVLEIADELRYHIPTDKKSDKFYPLISSALIKNICIKNRAVSRDISRKNLLSLEEYNELLCAVSFILYDYADKKIRCELEKFTAEYADKGYDFNITAAEMYALAMGQGCNMIWWNIAENESGYKVLRLKRSDDGTAFRRYGKDRDNITLSAQTHCIQIGKCKCYADGNMIYCYPADMELFFVKRDGNKFIGYGMSSKFPMSA